MKDFTTRWRERLLPLLLGMLLAGGAGAATHVLVEREGGVAEIAAVSYTHLTLPTIYSV